MHGWMIEWMNDCLAGLFHAAIQSIKLSIPLAIFANLAQLVEQLIRNEQVAGSIPAVGSKNEVFTFQFLQFEIN